VVIAKLNVVCVPVNEAKTDPPLVVYRDRILTLSISHKRMKPVVRRHLEIVEARSEINILELSSSSLCDVSWNPLPFARGVELLSTPIRERFDHDSSVTRRIRGGRAHSRTALFLSAMVAIRYNCDIKRFYERLLAAGKHKKVALTAAFEKSSPLSTPCFATTALAIIFRLTADHSRLLAVASVARNG
jgi:hypothetical protein